MNAKEAYECIYFHISLQDDLESEKSEESVNVVKVKKNKTLTEKITEKRLAREEEEKQLNTPGGKRVHQTLTKSHVNFNCCQVNLWKS